MKTYSGHSNIFKVIIKTSYCVVSEVYEGPVCVSLGEQQQKCQLQEQG